MNYFPWTAEQGGSAVVGARVWVEGAGVGGGSGWRECAGVGEGGSAEGRTRRYGGCAAVSARV